MALAAISYDVENFVLISTDKAVRATNVMGASKGWLKLFCKHSLREALMLISQWFDLVTF